MLINIVFVLELIYGKGITPPNLPIQGGVNLKSNIIDSETNSERIRAISAVDSADEKVTKCHVRGEVASHPTKTKFLFYN